MPSANVQHQSETLTVRSGPQLSLGGFGYKSDGMNHWDSSDQLPSLQPRQKHSSFEQSQRLSQKMAEIREVACSLDSAWCRVDGKLRGAADEGFVDAALYPAEQNETVSRCLRELRRKLAARNWPLADEVKAVQVVIASYRDAVEAAAKALFDSPEVTGMQEDWEIFADRLGQFQDVAAR